MMGVNKLNFFELPDKPQLGIRIDLVNRSKNKVINFDELKRMLPFFERAGASFIELGNLNSFDPKTKKCTSIFALEPQLIPPESLQKEFPALDLKLPLKEAFHKFITKNKGVFLPSLVNFEKMNATWIRDYACFMAIAEHVGTNAFNTWPDGIRDHDRRILEVVRYQLADGILIENILQFFAYQACQEFIEQAHQRGIYVSADLEPLCDEHCAEAWSHHSLLYLNSEFLPTVYIGLPPSKSLMHGEKTSNVPYRWQELHNDSFDLFRQLFTHHAGLFDYGHIKHGYSFFHYWELAYSESNPKYGRWVTVNSDLFFEYTREQFNKIPYFFDFNEPLFPRLELSLKRRSFLESVILGEPRNHTCQEYDLSRPIHMLCSQLCDTKVEISDTMRQMVLENASNNIKTISKDRTKLKIIHIDELCTALGVETYDLILQPQKYGTNIKNLFFPQVSTQPSLPSNNAKSSIFSKIANFLYKNDSEKE